MEDDADTPVGPSSGSGSPQDENPRQDSEAGEQVYDEQGIQDTASSSHPPTRTGREAPDDDRPQAERARTELHAAKEYAEMLVDAVREGLVVLDTDLQVLSANQSFYGMFEVEPAETTGRLVYELGEGQWDIPELRRLLEDVLPEEKELDDFEVARPFPKIGYREMVLNARRVDEHALILLAIEDVTERREAAAIARQSDRHLAAVYNQAKVGISELTREGRFLRVNQELCRILDRSRETLLDASIADVTHPEDAQRSIRVLGGVLETGEPDSLDKRYVRPDGTVVWANSAVNLLQHDGSPASVVVVTVDLTERKQAEEDLRQSEERYRLLVESAKEYAIFLIDVEGRIDSWNQGAEHLFGYTEAEIIGQPLATIFTEEQRDAGVPEAELGQAARDGRASDERWHVRKDGSVFWASGVVEAMRREDGTLHAFAKVLRDNTDRKEAQDELNRLNESLEMRVEERTHEVQELASALTIAEHRERRRLSEVLHDHVQQLLFGAEMTVRRMRSRLQGQEPSANQEVLGLLDQAGEIIGEATDATRTLSIELSPPVVRKEGLAEVLRWLASHMKERHALTVDLQIRDEPEAGFALRALIYRILRELLFNVVKHAGVDRAQLSMWVEPGVLKIEVQDEGDGFEPSSATKRHGGYGLSGMHDRLESIGGHMEIHSAPQRGTRILIVVPDGFGEEPST